MCNYAKAPLILNLTIEERRVSAETQNSSSKSRRDSLAGSPADPSPSASGSVPLTFCSIVLCTWVRSGRKRRAPIKARERHNGAILAALRSKENTHVSAIIKTSYALSHHGRLVGGITGIGMKGVSQGHSVSMSASASVPISQLRTSEVEHEQIKLK